ncbi:MAG: hypothetical protein RAO92_00015 [Candidatus Euphemobacter frigidus]|nr:hypothetical protein [Candidatus Euphemobacter frigidus]MDP8274762.1 hypothetical protein [Candidatus Euphemobacter frigidus]
MSLSTGSCFNLPASLQSGVTGSQAEDSLPGEIENFVAYLFRLTPVNKCFGDGPGDTEFLIDGFQKN